MIYHIISGLCIAILLLIAFGYGIAIFKKGREKRIDFIRKFKKGNCAIVYLVSIPLYWIGHLFAGQSFFPAFFAAINKTMVLVVLRYDMSTISGLMADNLTYKIAVYVCFTLVALNAMLFLLSFLHQKIWESIKKKHWKWSKRDKLLLIGNNSDNIKIYASEKNRLSMILDDIPEKEKMALFAKRVSFVSKSSDTLDILQKNADDDGPDFSKFTRIEKYAYHMMEKALSKKSGSFIIVVNQKDDEKNISLCHKLILCTKNIFKGKDDTTVADVLSRVKVYVFGMPSHDTIYNSLAEASNGCIRYVNKYKAIAMDFIERYPLTQFMTEKHVDYKTSLVREDIKINVAMIGLGKTNEQIFLTSVSNNQFAEKKDGNIVLKPVDYYIFDKQHLDNNKNLNHSLYRYKNEFYMQFDNGKNEELRAKYLPLPALPSNDHYDKLDINDPSFYKKLKGILSGDKSYNYVIIGFGTDLENIDMAHKILDKKMEWGLSDTYVFVKVRSGDDSFEIFKRDDCFMIGDENRVVYNINQIDNYTITEMAKMRNRIYTLEYEIASKPVKSFVDPCDEVYAKADREWYIKKTQFERESNIYSCLALRSKLHVMGLDYEKKNEKKKHEALSKNAYMECYASNDAPVFFSDKTADGKEIVNYTLDFKDSRRKTMAIQEHFRWNSFMISKGFIPSSIEEITNDREKNGKNYTLRRHGSLTTFDGLEKFRRIIAERPGETKDELSADVIKYDYQLLDDAYWLLDKNDYQIVRREK